MIKISKGLAESRLDALKIALPKPSSPIANYVPFTRANNTLYISGQVSNDGQDGIKGTLGVDLDLEAGILAARFCAINLLAQMKAAADGELDNVLHVLKLNIFVQAGPEFYDIPKVGNGCSDLLVDVLGDMGRHARSAVGVYKLPAGFAVEVDAVVELTDRR
jgi:enamine deaminase RidA (YjgF/YER057c/UK114 family)